MFEVNPSPLPKYKTEEFIKMIGFENVTSEVNEEQKEGLKKVIRALAPEEITSEEMVSVVNSFYVLISDSESNFPKHINVMLQKDYFNTEIDDKINKLIYELFPKK